MERVAFIVEPEGHRLDCLLNPESLRLTRQAGTYAPRARARPLVGAERSDDPLLFVGGGVTELVLQLLFDLELLPEERRAHDVRELTRPLWDLAENPLRGERRRQPPLVRFVWGKSWNVLGAVLAVSERLERFNGGGVPSRSWLQLRLRRVSSPSAPPVDPQSTDAAQTEQAKRVLATLQQHDDSAGAGADVAAAGESVVGGEQRLDELAARHYGNPALWRAIASYNDLDASPTTAGDAVLQLPRLSELEGGT